MRRRYALLFFTVTIMIIAVTFSFTGFADSSLSFSTFGDGVIDKRQREAFTVKITFKNTGNTDGTWSVNVALEGDSWSWRGTPQRLTLKPNGTKTVVWNGSVPYDATVHSVARLVAYYDDSFERLNWWIRVVSGAEIAIVSSTLE